MRGPLNTPTMESGTADRGGVSPCPDCCGEGYLEVIGGPGTFDEREECWLPSEDIEPCSTCRGTGVIELVPACSEGISAPERVSDRPRPQDRGKEDAPWTTTSWTR